jgi:hypothetical protein
MVMGRVVLRFCAELPCLLAFMGSNEIGSTYSGSSISIDKPVRRRMLLCNVGDGIRHRQSFLGLIKIQIQKLAVFDNEVFKVMQKESRGEEQVKVSSQWD